MNNKPGTQNITRYTTTKPLNKSVMLPVGIPTKEILVYIFPKTNALFKFNDLSARPETHRKNISIPSSPTIYEILYPHTEGGFTSWGKERKIRRVDGLQHWAVRIVPKSTDDLNETPDEAGKALGRCLER